MREIKFRAWFEYESRMIEWGDLHLETDEKGLFIWIGDDEHDNFGSATGVDKSEFTLMQYTDLTDKNGVEIYEGDVINRPSHFGFYIEFKRGVYRAIPTNPIQRVNWIHRAVIDMDLEEWEVIGNIYENLELLEESP